MTVRYEWDVETETIDDTHDHESGECIDHNHKLSYAEALAEASREAPKGCRYQIVLVRDNGKGRLWAYVDDGLLPAYFMDSLGNDTLEIPERFVEEVAKATKAAALKERVHTANTGEAP
jgi:hypothetical protein